MLRRSHEKTFAPSRDSLRCVQFSARRRDFSIGALAAAVRCPGPAVGRSEGEGKGEKGEGEASFQRERGLSEQCEQVDEKERIRGGPRLKEDAERAEAKRLREQKKNRRTREKKREGEREHIENVFERKER